MGNMGDTKLLRSKFKGSVLFFFLAFLCVILIACPPMFFGATDQEEHVRFLVLNSPFIIFFFFFLVLMNFYFIQSDRGSCVAFNWWIPEVLFLVIIIAMLIFLFFFGLFIFVFFLHQLCIRSSRPNDSSHQRHNPLWPWQEKRDPKIITIL